MVKSPLRQDPEATLESAHFITWRIVRAAVSARPPRVEPADAHAHTPPAGADKGMTRSITVAGVALELEERGEGRRCCSCIPARGWQPRAAVARSAGAALSRDRAVSSRLGQLAAARLARARSTTSPISISISPRRSELRGRGPGRRLLRRLDRRRDDGARHARVSRSSCWSIRSASRSAA